MEVPLISIAIVALVIASFNGSSEPDHRGATGAQLAWALIGAIALAAGLVAWASRGSDAPCGAYAQSDVVGDC